MGTAQSAVDYRNMIRDVADVLVPGNPNDIQNIITDPLPNGAKCYVVSRRATYVLNKFSTLAANGIEILAPIAGPGRWFLEGVVTGEVPVAELYSTNPNTFVTDGVLNQPATALFSVEKGANLAAWTLTASGGILTYNGPDTPAWAIMTASVNVANADALRAILGFISHNNDNPGFAVGTTIAGVVEVVQTVADEIVMLVAQRRIPALQTGNTIRPKFGSSAPAVSGSILSLQLTVRPG